MFFLKFIFITTTLLVWLGHAWAGCPSMQEIDTVAEQTIYFGNRKVVVPSDQANLDKYCGAHENALNSINDYVKNCLQDDLKPMAGSIYGIMNEHFQQQCKNADFGQLFITHSQCFLNGDILEEFHQCGDRWFQIWAGLANIDPALRLPAACCLFFDFQSCAEEKNTRLCHDANAKFWKDTFEEMSSEMMDKFCKGYQSSEQCTANFPQDVWNSLTDPVNAMDANQLKSRSKFRSAFFHVLDMLSQYKL